MSAAAEVFSLPEILCEEMTARGWTTDDVGARMGMRGAANDALGVSLLISVSQNDPRLLIDDETYEGLARAFDVSADFFRTIHTQWLGQTTGRNPFEAPDEMFGPATRAALDRARRTAS